MKRIGRLRELTGTRSPFAAEWRAPPTGAGTHPGDGRPVPARHLLDHVALTQDLEDLLGRRVEVVTRSALHWYIRDRVLAEAVPL